MCSISKRIGDIRLSDFKALFDRPGFYRYHFKAVDQEFGMVKEEVRIYKKIILLLLNLLQHDMVKSPLFFNGINFILDFNG